MRSEWISERLLCSRGPGPLPYSIYILTLGDIICKSDFFHFILVPYSSPISRLLPRQYFFCLVILPKSDLFYDYLCLSGWCREESWKETWNIWSNNTYSVLSSQASGVSQSGFELLWSCKAHGLATPYLSKLMMPYTPPRPLCSLKLISCSVLRLTKDLSPPVPLLSWMVFHYKWKRNVQLKSLNEDWCF